MLALVVLLLVAPTAYGQHGKTVGISASGCSRFTEEVGRNPRLERDCFAWAQGLMCAFVLKAPQGG
jgi:hypothetical protein